MLSVVGHPCAVNPDLRLAKLAGPTAGRSSTSGNAPPWRPACWSASMTDPSSPASPSPAGSSAQPSAASPPRATRPTARRRRAVRVARAPARALASDHPLVVTLDKQARRAPSSAATGSSRSISPRARASSTRGRRIEALKDVDAAIRYALNHPLRHRSAPREAPAGDEGRHRDRRHLAAAAADAPARRARARAHDRARAARRPRRRRRRDHHRDARPPPHDGRRGPPHRRRPHLRRLLARTASTTTTPRTRRA